MSGLAHKRNLKPESRTERDWNRDVLGAAPAYAEVKTVTGTTYTLVPDDCGKMLLFTSNSDVAVTVPASAFPADAEAVLVRGGSGEVAVSAGPGVTINMKDGASGILNGNLGAAMLKQDGASASWWFFGDYT